MCTKRKSLCGKRFLRRKNGNLICSKKLNYSFVGCGSYVSLAFWRSFFNFKIFSSNDRSCRRNCYGKSCWCNDCYCKFAIDLYGSFLTRWSYAIRTSCCCCDCCSCCSFRKFNSRSLNCNCSSSRTFRFLSISI